MSAYELSNPAYRIETKRLVVRCYNPSDAQLLAESVNESLEHLRHLYAGHDLLHLRQIERVRQAVEQHSAPAPGT